MREIVRLVVGCTAMFATTLGMQTVHIGVLDQQTGSFEKQFMAYARDMYLDWLKTKQNNQICGEDVDFVFHRMDGQSNKDLLPSLAVDFMNGNWTRTYFTPENGFNDEPEQHELDVMFLGWSSALIPFALQGLKDAGIKKPVYAGGSSGTGAWFENSDMYGTGRWDFAVNPQSMSDLEMTEILKFLKNSGAKSIVILEESGVGAWTQAVARGGRTAAKDLGLKIVADETIEWPCKFPDASDSVSDCEEQNFKALENTLGGAMKRGKRKITADVFVGALYGYACPHELKWFEKNNINFGAYALMLCLADSTARSINGHRHKFILGATGWNGQLNGEHFDESFSAVQIYPEAGPASADAYAKDFQSRYNLYPHYIDAWSFATWYYFHDDFVSVNCDHTKLIDRMAIKRSPIPSFFGLLGSGDGGVNNFHKYIGVQVFPDDVAEPRIVAPAHLATDIGIYPCPTWHERDCWPDCVPCPFCDDIIASSLLVYTLVCSPIFMFMIIVAYWHFVLDFRVRNIWIDVPRIGFVLLNITSDVMAVLLMFAMMDEELLEATNEYLALLYCYLCLSVISVWCSMVRILWLRAVIYWNIQNSKTQKNENDIALTKDNVTNESIEACQQELAVTCVSCVLCDLPIFIVQFMMLSYVVNQALAVSLPLIWSMIFSAITIGSVSNSTAEFSLYTIIGKLRSKDIPDSKTSFKATVMLLINPFATCANPTNSIVPEDKKYNVDG